MTATERENEHLLCGRIGSPFGNKGELKFFSDWTVDIGDFVGKEIMVDLNGKVSFYELISARPHKNHYVISLAGFGDMMAAEGLKGGKVHVNGNDLPRENGEIYFTDIDGFEAITESGKILGRIIGFAEMRSYDLLNIEQGNKNKVQVPMIDENILRYEISEKKVIISEICFINYYEN